MGDPDAFTQGDRVAVYDPGLAVLRDIMRRATGVEPPPNNEGVVEEVYDDGTVLIVFDDGIGVPYPAADTRKVPEPKL